ncbi:MAG: 3-dehydroquinate synthase II [Thermodesulfobacteriota bacterium]|nr:3-dehydroquinate synthase II [Desulfovibrionales bacterium]MDQ7837600.1 3-dehydroquinate synthase II [Thermodesulfobacteriota bacterium]
MKQIWVKVIPWKKKLVTTALENGADALVLAEGDSEKAKKLGRIPTVAPDGDLKWGEDVVEVTIRGSEDEKEVVRLAQTRKVVATTTDWTVIPLENIVAQTNNVLVETSNLEDARTALGVLEKGVDGVVINVSEPAELKKILTSLRETGGEAPLTIGEVVSIKTLGMGDRVCIDTCTQMGKGEGMLIGNTSQALFLVHAESVENPYVATRPFRVNAGPVHAYVRVPGGKTRYLSELKSGDEVLMVNSQGKSGPVVVGRVKIEKRPLVLIEARAEGKVFSTILQNAETIRLTRPDGEPVSIVSLKEGDQVLMSVEAGGRHFGYHIEETITEK